MAPVGIHLDPASKAKVIRYLHGGWQPQAVANEIGCHLSTVTRIEANLHMFGSAMAPQQRQRGRPRKIHGPAEQSLLEYLVRYPWAYLDEMRVFLLFEWDIDVSIQAVFKLLKRCKWSRKAAERISDRQDPALRRAFKDEALDWTAEMLVFLDESMFNETNGWRHYGYAPVGLPARYHADRTRGKGWSVLPAYTMEGYIAVEIRQGWFNKETFQSFIKYRLLPLCNPFPGPRSVIILDNAGIHTDPELERIVEAEGCLLRYLPAYSPDLNPEELTFSVLKGWMKRHFREYWPSWGGDFGSFLSFAINASKCDQFPRQHFKHTGAYLFEGDLEEVERMAVVEGSWEAVVVDNEAEEE